MQVGKAVCVTFMAGAAFLVFALSPGSAAPQATGSPEVVHSQNTNVLPPYEVFEITFLHDGQYADLIGDNLDADVDGDGHSDAEEVRAGTNPLDPLSFPAE